MTRTNVRHRRENLTAAITLAIYPDVVGRDRAHQTATATAATARRWPAAASGWTSAAVAMTGEVGAGNTVAVRAALDAFRQRSDTRLGVCAIPIAAWPCSGTPLLPRRPRLRAAASVGDPPTRCRRLRVGVLTASPSASPFVTRSPGRAPPSTIQGTGEFAHHGDTSRSAAVCARGRTVKFVLPLRQRGKRSCGLPLAGYTTGEPPRV